MSDLDPVSMLRFGLDNDHLVCGAVETPSWERVSWRRVGVIFVSDRATVP